MNMPQISEFTYDMHLLQRTSFSKIWFGMLSFFIQENTFEIVVCQNGDHIVQREMKIECRATGILGLKTAHQVPPSFI